MPARQTSNSRTINMVTLLRGTCIRNGWGCSWYQSTILDSLRVFMRKCRHFKLSKYSSEGTPRNNNKKVLISVFRLHFHQSLESGLLTRDTFLHGWSSSLFCGIFQGSNTARATPRLVSFRGLMSTPHRFIWESHPFTFGCVYDARNFNLERF